MIYDGWKPIAEYDGSGNFVAWNIYGAGADEILMRYQVGIGYLHYHSDAMGNVQFLLDINNNGVEKYTYDVFGQPKITDWNGVVRVPMTSNYGNRFMFTGREYLSEPGIYDYRSRAYHPGLGRFLQVDPIGFGGDDANLFRYCANNPVNWIDPWGLLTFQIGGAANFNFGFAAASFNVGFAIDGHGNFGSYVTSFGGGGLGARAAGGLSLAASNADTISGLGGKFTNVNGGGGPGGSGSGNGFWGHDPTNGKFVYGGGITIGLGVGGGGNVGRSYTTIGPIWSPTSGFGGERTSSDRFIENFAAGQTGGNTPWAVFGAPIGATNGSYGTQNEDRSITTAVPTYWGRGEGNAPVAAAAVPRSGYGSPGYGGAWGNFGLSGGYTGSAASYFGSGMSGFASGFGPYSSGAGTPVRLELE